MLARPKHPYTWALVNAVPRLDDPVDKRLTVIEGLPPDPTNWPSGCRFAARCPFRVSKCDEHPALLPVMPGRVARCWVTQAGADLPARRAGRVEVALSAPAATASSAEPLLEVRDLVKHFPLGLGLFAASARVHAIDGVDLSVASGETLGLVGESGCGNRRWLGSLPGFTRPTEGRFYSEDRTSLPRIGRNCGPCVGACRWFSRTRSRRSIPA